MLLKSNMSSALPDLAVHNEELWQSHYLLHRRDRVGTEERIRWEHEIVQFVHDGLVVLLQMALVVFF